MHTRIYPECQRGSPSTHIEILSQRALPWWHWHSVCTSHLFLQQWGKFTCNCNYKAQARSFSPLTAFLKKRRSQYKMNEKGKKLRRAARRKRKGFEDKHKEKGVMYASGVLDLDDGDAPGPSMQAWLTSSWTLTCNHKTELVLRWWPTFFKPNFCKCMNGCCYKYR